MTTKINKLLLKDKNAYTICVLEDIEKEDAFLNKTAQKLKDGADVIEFFAKNITDRDFLSVAKKLRDLCGVFNALLVVRRRIDIAKLANADGVVLDGDSIGISEAFRLTESNILLGYHAQDGISLKEDEVGICDFVVSKEPINADIKAFQTN